LREDRFDRRVASLVMGAGTVEHFRKHFEINDLGNIEEGLGLLTAFQLMGAQEFRSLFADPIALGLHKSGLSVVQKAQSSLLPNRLHQQFVYVRRVANRPACSSIRRACSHVAQMRTEYDFDYSKAVRGKYYKRLLKEGSNVVVLDRDVAKAFPNSASVNKALRSVLRRKRLRRLTARLTRTRARAARAG
jgi:hypothetical protein